MKDAKKQSLGLNGLDELFMTDRERAENKLPRIYDIPLSEIDDFPDHPFKVRMDEDMDLLVQSVKERGIIVPITLREKEDGRYELVSGHRRKKACEFAGFDTIRAEIRDLTRDEAIILMVESNLQRSVILPSEKAFSYKMRLEAMNRQGQRTDLTSNPVGGKFGESAAIIGNLSGDSGTQVRRYIRLTELIPPLLDSIAEAEADKASAFVISQEDIDYILGEGSNYSDSKYRIYSQYLRQEPAADNVRFLKSEYGTGGVYPVGVEKKFSVDYDSKGIRLRLGNIVHPDADKLLNWPKVEKRIRELIQSGRYPAQIRALEQKAEGYTADIERVKENTHPSEDGFSPMVIEGTRHTEKKAAGSAILEACKAIQNSDPVPLGQYRGFEMELCFDPMFREYKITLIGALRHQVFLGSDVYGNIQRLDNALEGLPASLSKTQEAIKSAQQNLEQAKAELNKPFPFEEELATKSARLGELNAMLDMDKPENEIVDGERSEDDSAPAPERIPDR